MHDNTETEFIDFCKTLQACGYPKMLLWQSFQYQTPPQKGAGKLVPSENCRKVSKICLALFDDFELFALREKCRKVSKIFLTLFDDFDFFDVAPFRWPLLRSTDSEC